MYYSKERLQKLCSLKNYYDTNREVLCFVRRGRYHLSEPRLSIKYAYIKQLQEKLLDDPCLGAKLCAWFTCVNEKVARAMSAKNFVQHDVPNSCRKIVFSALEQRKKSAGELLSCVRSVNCMKFPHNDFGEGIHTASSEPWFYDTAYNAIKHHNAIPVHDVLGVCFIGKNLCITVVTVVL